jgi:hypothetical protein
MTRRTALGAAFAIIGQQLVDSSHVWKTPMAEELTVYLGGTGTETGFKRFTFVHGNERVTISAEELFAALKEGK